MFGRCGSSPPQWGSEVWKVEAKNWNIEEAARGRKNESCTREKRASIFVSLKKWNF